MTALEILESRIAICDGCHLHKTVINKVPGEGNASAALVIVGEAPGREENSSGRPFVGEAGKLLDKAFEKLSICRGDFFICNLLKCRPPNNSITTDIRDECIPVCAKFLEEQVQAIKPKVLLALGALAMQNLIDVHASIGKMRGKAMAGPAETLVVPTWHPAYLLRLGGIGNKSKQRASAKEFIADFKLALDLAEVRWTERKEA